MPEYRQAIGDCLDNDRRLDMFDLRPSQPTSGPQPRHWPLAETTRSNERRALTRCDRYPLSRSPLTSRPGLPRRCLRRLDMSRRLQQGCDLHPTGLAELLHDLYVLVQQAAPGRSYQADHGRRDVVGGERWLEGGLDHRSTGHAATGHIVAPVESDERLDIPEAENGRWWEWPIESSVVLRTRSATPSPPFTTPRWRFRGPASRLEDQSSLGHMGLAVLGGSSSFCGHGIADRVGVPRDGLLEADAKRRARAEAE